MYVNYQLVYDSPHTGTGTVELSHCSSCDDDTGTVLITNNDNAENGVICDTNWYEAVGTTTYGALNARVICHMLGYQ